jgi:hypothetical protein
MGAARRIMSLGKQTVALVGLLVLGSAQAAEGQVGLTSGMAQVTLVARIAPRGSIQAVGAQRETARQGTVREVSVTVGLSANTGYQLIVRGTAVPASRVWVRSATGEYQELTSGTSVTVARDTRCAGQWQREVQYRIETSDAAGSELQNLPVRYEIAINPVM